MMRHWHHALSDLVAHCLGLYRPDGMRWGDLIEFPGFSFCPPLVIIHFAVRPSIPAAKIEFLEEILPFRTKTNVAGAKMFSDLHKFRHSMAYSQQGDR